jgi:hypothetical protein
MPYFLLLGNIEQSFFGATTALLRAKNYLDQVTTSSFPENYINVHHIHIFELS